MSREKMLEEIRSALPAPVELPEIGDLGVRFDDKTQMFAEMLTLVGGTPKSVNSIEEANEILQQQFAASHDRWLSFCPGIDGKDADPAASRGAHDYQDVDLVVLEGVFGVAENGAIWVPLERVSHPACLVLSQHLAIVIREPNLVDNMHQAYARIEAAGDLPTYGVFVSGPSKTADIEQSLVIGAHGARSLTVFILP